MNTPAFDRLIAILKSIPPLARSWNVRESELMRRNPETSDSMEAFIQLKPRYRENWFRLETRWMGGEMD